MLLQQALAYEASEVPSLTGFLAWHEAEERDDQAAGRTRGGAKLRVMTVHGAKGLEAPVVILPDTADLVARERARTLARRDGQPIFRSVAASGCRRRSPVSMRRKSHRREEEANRLLYVALTRARELADRLRCRQGRGERGQACLLASPGRRCLGGTGPAPDRAGGGGGAAGRTGRLAAARRRDAPVDATVAAPPLPAWARLPGEPGPPLPRLVSPSRLGRPACRRGWR